MRRGQKTGGFVTATVQVGPSPRGILRQIKDAVPGRLGVKSAVFSGSGRQCYLTLRVRYPAEGDVWGAWQDDVREAMADAVAKAGRGTSQAVVDVLEHRRCVTKSRAVTAAPEVAATLENA